MSASNEWLSSGVKTADVAIKASAGTLGGLVVLTDGTNAATAILYDDPDSAAGTVIGKLIVAGADRFGVLLLPPYGVVAQTGIYLDIGGTGAEAIVYYR